MAGFVGEEEDFVGDAGLDWEAVKYLSSYLSFCRSFCLSFFLSVYLSNLT